MSEGFELMNQRARNSAAVQLSRVALSSAPNPANHYLARVPDEALAAGMWRIIRRRKWTIAAFTLVVVGIVVTASLLMKPQYKAVGRVVVMFHRDNDSGLLGFRGADTFLLDDPEDRTAIDTQIRILQTDALAMQVIKTLQLDKNPNFTGQGRSVNQDALLQLFRTSLEILRVKGTRLIEIQFRSTDPHLAADVVNSLAKEYVDQYYRSQFQVSTQFSDFLANKLKELQARVEESQRKLMDYQKQNGLFGLDDKQNIVTTKLTDLNRELTAAEVDRVQKDVNYQLGRSGQPDLVARLGSDNLLTRLRAQQVDLANQIAQASVQLGPAHPKMAELSKQLEQVERSADAELKAIGERITYEYQTAAERERMLRDALEAQKEVVDRLNASAVQSDILKHEFETNRKLYEDLLQKQKEVGISASLKSSNIWIVDPARPPKLPAEPNIPRNVALSLLFGICGGVWLSFGLAKMKERTINTVEQAQALSSLPALGVLPLMEAKSKNGALRQLAGGGGDVDHALVSLLQPMSLAAESYKTVLTSLLLSQPTPPSVIQVTSALPGGGKTIVSMNLAILLARLRKRVLLVDGDLRRPQIHHAMRLSGNTGLGPLLRNTGTFEEAVVSWANVPNLFILPAGPVILPDDTELLMWSFQDWIKRWREQFDHIIIDTPPVLPVADAIRMSVEVDSVILVIRAGQTDRDDFLRAQDLLLKVNAPLAGFVLNGANLDSSDFRYCHSYYSQDQTKLVGDRT